MKLADDFGIPYSGRDRGSPKNRRSVPIKKPEPTPEEIWQKKYLRCYHLGCKADEMLCLVGQQGAGKSTFFRFLALNDDWFSDDLKQLNEARYTSISGDTESWKCQR